tara:strand:+ start:653 stop:1084 length:432 start_codon:yes stop_codon:yes gene_type:complete
MSKRELIAIDIVSTLLQIDNPKPIYVVREPITVEQLSDQQFPAVVVRTANEEREDITMSTSTNRRMGTITYEITCYTRGVPVDTTMNEMVEVITEKLQVDRTRNGNCLIAQTTGVIVDPDTLSPYGEVTIIYEAEYDYIRGEN